MDVLNLMTEVPVAWIGSMVVLGLVIGSFLNVVIHRLPRMLELDWRAQCRELLELPVEPAVETVNLWRPGSRCPHCGHAIRVAENIPLLSWLALRGRCSACRQPISVRYPLVELLTGVLSGLVAWRFGFGWEAAAALGLTWTLIAASFIDIDYQLLPDVLTLPLLWAGLVLSLTGLTVTPAESILGATVGYLSLWTLYHLFRLATGKEGMGYGDFKLLGALGAWMGWQSLPMMVLLSSLVGAILGLVILVAQRLGRDHPIPFGPYIAAAGWISLMWGDELAAAYLRLAGLS